MLSNQQFERTRRLASRLAGIDLSERHRELVDRRGRRRGILDGAGMDSLLDAADRGEPLATHELLCLLTTRFTSFFRHPRHFEIAASHARQAAHQRGRARLWSAAAATGEEPWSLAIAMIEAFEGDATPVDVLATDIDVDALEFARRGEYGGAALDDLEPGIRERYFTETPRTRRWSIRPSVRPLVRFRALNLAAIDWEVEGPFDVIFCRNVLMYLETCHRYSVLERLASLLAPNGRLMLDPAEHLGNASHLYLPGVDGVYAGRRAGSRSLASRPPCLPCSTTNEP